MMENFFKDDNYCHDLEDLIRICDLEDNGAIESLEDDWSVQVELTDLRPIFQLTPKSLTEMLFNCNEDQYPEDESADVDILRAVKECVDFEKLNSLIPSLYYPNGDSEIITKQDLLEFIQ